MKQYFVLDGSGYMYRCYYGLPDMRDGEGNPCNALFGMMKMVCGLLLQQPAKFLIARDAPHKTLRHESFAEYKGTRSATPDDLKHQFSCVRGLFSDLKLPHLEKPGYEADDIIASIAWTKREDTYVRIYTSDKDLGQLVSDSVHVLDPRTSLSLTPSSFMEKRGFSPVQMLDYLSLIGDASDNIPGVMGIGPKGATKLITEYGNLDSIYENIAKLPQGMQDKLTAGKESCYMSRDLVQLMQVPGLDASRDEPGADWSFDSTVWTGVIEQYGFPSLAKDIELLRQKYETPQQESLF